MTDETQPSSYPRDLVGYGRNVPHAQWPGGAKIALQFVLNYEEGGENNVLHGDPTSETFLSELVTAQAYENRHMTMESMYEYGSRAGAWRILREIESRGLPMTIFAVGMALQRYPELLKRLVVEITEQEDLDRACLERKRNVPGFSGSFALDDYGSGYSNELNLLELSPRYIKIDISIVRGIDTDRDKQQIVSNIVAYAHARSMQLIAEGIETEAQLRTVIGLGVDLLQGYYLSRPAAVPAPIAPAAQAVIDQLEHQRFNPLGL